MIDAECQQLHNEDYRFEDGLNGGKNGVFGFSANWCYFWHLCLVVLSRIETIPVRLQKAADFNVFRGFSLRTERLYRSDGWHISGWTNA